MDNLVFTLAFHLNQCITRDIPNPDLLEQKEHRLFMAGFDEKVVLYREMLTGDCSDAEDESEDDGEDESHGDSSDDDNSGADLQTSVVSDTPTSASEANGAILTALQTLEDRLARTAASDENLADEARKFALATTAWLTAFLKNAGFRDIQWKAVPDLQPQLLILLFNGSVAVNLHCLPQHDGLAIHHLAALCSESLLPVWNRNLKAMQDFPSSTDTLRTMFRLLEGRINFHRRAFVYHSRTPASASEDSLLKAAVSDLDDFFKCYATPPSSPTTPTHHTPTRQTGQVLDVSPEDRKFLDRAMAVHSAQLQFLEQAMAARNQSLKVQDVRGAQVGAHARHHELANSNPRLPAASVIGCV